jgi:hypothetical protein
MTFRSKTRKMKVGYTITLFFVQPWSEDEY